MYKLSHLLLAIIWFLHLPPGSGFLRLLICDDLSSRDSCHHGLLFCVHILCPHWDIGSVPLPPWICAGLWLISLIEYGGKDTGPVLDLLFKRMGSSHCLSPAALNCFQWVQETLLREKPHGAGPRHQTAWSEEVLFRQPGQSSHEGNPVWVSQEERSQAEYSQPTDPWDNCSFKPLSLGVVCPIAVDILNTVLRVPNLIFCKALPCWWLV